MTFQDATDHLRVLLLQDGAETYRFPCRKAFLLARIAGTSKPLRFKARDDVRFRIDERGLTVETLRNGAVLTRLSWALVESLAVGEPETDNGLLFQG